MGSNYVRNKFITTVFLFKSYNIRIYATIILDFRTLNFVKQNVKNVFFDYKYYLLMFINFISIQS